MKLRALIVVIILVAGAVAVYVGRRYFPAKESVNVAHSAEMNADVAEVRVSSSVELPTDKLKAAGVSLTKVVRTQLRPENKVPGRLKYDDRRHVEVRSATPGIITAVRVNPGDYVHAGDVLIELSSPEVGMHEPTCCSERPP